MAPEVTAEQLHGWFGAAIKRPQRRPDMALCVELAEKINHYRPLFDEVHSFWPAGATRDLIVTAVRDARRLDHSLRLIPLDEVNRLYLPGFIGVEELLAALARFHEPFGSRLPSRALKSNQWVYCAQLLTPHIVDTLREAGWRLISKTSKDGPVIAVLRELIGLVTGDKPPDRASLGSILRQHKTRKKPRQK